MSQLEQSRIVAIIGGANGIGLACANILRQSGWTPVLIDRDAAAGQRAAAELQCAFYEVDLLKTDQLESLCERVSAEVGPVSGLINSAGISQPTASPAELPTDTWDAVQRIHVRGGYLSCRAFGTAMAKRRHGSIVNVASITGLRSAPLHSYGPAKAALISMTENLAAEWGLAGVRVNAVSPGFTRTERVERRIEAGERNRESYVDSALGRMVEPAEVAQACRFLLSDAASGITGVNLPVDAGWLVSGSWRAFGGLRQYAPAS